MHPDDGQEQLRIDAFDPVHDHVEPAVQPDAGASPVEAHTRYPTIGRAANEPRESSGAMIALRLPTAKGARMNLRAYRPWTCQILTVLVVLIATGLSANARAQTWIVGASVGAAQQQDYAIGGPIANSDDVDTAFGLFGGYQIKENQRVVASFVDLGEPSYSGPARGGFTDALDAEGFDISYVAGWSPGDQERISVFGSVGVFSWDQDVRYSDASGPLEFRDEGTSFSIGFGADFNLSADGSSPWAIHVAYKLFKDVGKVSILEETAEVVDHELDRQVLSVGIAYRFGGD